MASVIYNSVLEDLAKGNVNFDADTFYVMLVTSLYVPNKDTHTKRSDITNESTGVGYVAGGKESIATLLLDTGNDRQDISFANTLWPSTTTTARGGVIYKRRGGLASADELVAYVDFGADITSTVGDFLVTFLSPFRIQN